MRRTIMAIGTAVALLLPPVPVHARVVVPSGSLEVVFNHPGLDEAADSAIEDKLDTLIRSTKAGGTIHASFYHTYSSTKNQSALKYAAEKGVSVRIVAEVCEDTDPCVADATIESTLQALDALPGFTVEKCRATCNATAYAGKGINHNKFFTFSALDDGRRNVVASGSANLNVHQRKLDNNFVISYDDLASYTGFVNYWNLMSGHAATPANVSKPITGAGGKLTTFFSPRDPDADAAYIAAHFTTPNTDLIAAFINDLNCDAPDGGSIRTISATWKDNRPEITAALTGQAKAGCSVEAMTDESVTAVAEPLAEGDVSFYGLRAGGCRTSAYPVAQNSCAGAGGTTHDKYTLVQGTSRKTGEAVKLVYSGSQNYTRGAMTVNNEVVQRIDDSAIYDAFLADYNRQKTKAIKLVPDKYKDASFSTVNSRDAGSQDHPAIAVNDAGHRAVAWADTANPVAVPSGRHGAIWLRLYGYGPGPLEVQVQAGGLSDYDYRDPQAGLDAAGNVVVVWQDDEDGNGHYDIAMRRVDTTGRLLGTKIRVNADNTGQQTAPALAVSASGEHVVTWTDEHVAGEPQIRAARYTAAGVKTSEAQVNGTSTGTHTGSSVALDAQGGAVVVWRDDSDGNNSGQILGKGLNRDGTLRFTERTINAIATGDQAEPAVDSTPAGEFVVVWQDFEVAAEPRVYARAFDSQGTPRFTDLPVSTYAEGTTVRQPREKDASGTLRVGNQYAPDVAVDDAGRFVVVLEESTPFHSGRDVFARGFDAAGLTAGRFPEYRMNPQTTHDQTTPVVAMTGTGTFALAYCDDPDGNGGTQLRLRAGFTIS
ncbi:phospholipase D-like domain-containing protein [Longispora albida]|uniref:phospholipase D-like domain-containing protein n=1 Tax=Longispora albida TaxID=203523 RepID=UPI0003A4CBEE|nr:phospholipase D-like domain-containing protein [Longispora albida]